MIHRLLKMKLPYVFILCLLLSGCAPSAGLSAGSRPETSPQSSVDTNPETIVHFIDVGQGDSILIESGGQTMLIDAGTNESGAEVLNYLKAQQITHLDWVIGTHPHEDHIGGLDDIILAVDTDRVMMPPKEHTTKTFEDVLDAVMEKDLSLTEPVIGDTYPLGDARFTVLGPAKDYGDDLNNWSVVLLLTCGDTSFLFTGDAEVEAEEDILASGLAIDADVLKVAHHGSDTSTSDAFLSAVSPDYAVISVGQDNDYGHPCQVTLDRLETAGADIFRTDLMGTVIAYSDGTHLSFSAESDPAQSGMDASADSSSFLWDTEETGIYAAQSGEGTDESAAETEEDIQVHITQSGSRYHREGCSSLENSDTVISLDEAKSRGYTPCQRCHPPE
ncbi:competence protein ComEC [Catenibacillus scindens]|uniref:Competence protein ComEC n=1 Tax=Catenibacillus scindens TaxID=673271 RepID=A0A7W8HBJ2_9FIRM|nr:MBL fold metallo-hydrolase [Catenibacillus scindens]MBB5265348.1 competence protein ComEC [Catenibacillus scindens]